MTQLLDQQSLEVERRKFHQLLDQPALEIGCDPKALHDYIKDNWPESHITELLRLLLDLSPGDMVK